MRAVEGCGEVGVVVGERGAGGGDPQPGRSVDPDNRSIAVEVEVDVGSATSWDWTRDRWWLVRLSCAERCVVVSAGLSYLAAEHLASQLSELSELAGVSTATPPLR